VNALAKLSAATTALAEAKTLDEVKHILDIAEAARTYARAAKLGLKAQNHAAAIKLRAEYKAGILLRDLERSNGGRPETRNSVLQVSEYSQVLEENDINRMTAHRWQTIAILPEETLEQHIAESETEEEELTSNSILRVAQEFKRQQSHQQKQEPSALPTKKYRVIYADPPWRYNNAGVITENDNYGRAARHYPTMSIDDLCAMGEKVKEIADQSAVLFMWVTSPLLEESFEVIRSWGFQYKTSFVWDKVKHNFGHYNSVRHELLLVCTKGSCTPDEKVLHDSVISIERSNKHSEKPEEFRRIIDGIYTWGERIELFARTAVSGWDCWGNEPGQYPAR
jgi:N6-adenosine-specific RNA methylase IME4